MQLFLYLLVFPDSSTRKLWELRTTVARERERGSAVLSWWITGAGEARGFNVNTSVRTGVNLLISSTTERLAGYLQADVTRSLCGRASSAVDPRSRQFWGIARWWKPKFQEALDLSSLWCSEISLNFTFCHKDFENCRIKIHTPISWQQSITRYSSQRFLITEKRQRRAFCKRLVITEFHKYWMVCPIK